MKSLSVVDEGKSSTVMCNKVSSLSLSGIQEKLDTTCKWNASK